MTSLPVVFALFGCVRHILPASFSCLTTLGSTQFHSGTVLQRPKSKLYHMIVGHVTNTAILLVESVSHVFSCTLIGREPVT